MAAMQKDITRLLPMEPSAKLIPASEEATAEQSCQLHIDENTTSAVTGKTLHVQSLA
jgi:hypothetical protein